MTDPTADSRLLFMSGSDLRLDRRGHLDVPINDLPVRCPECGFPDLDFVPEPYFVHRGRAATPAELALAEAGNLLVRPRVRSILDAVAPGQCSFHATAYAGSDDPTPWSLAVPMMLVDAFVPDPNPRVERCDGCGESRWAPRGSSHFLPANWNGRAPADVAKSRTWTPVAAQWRPKRPARALYLSLRLHVLLEMVGARGLDRTIPDRADQLDPAESPWIDDAMAKLRSIGVPPRPLGVVAPEDARWFRRWLQANRSGSPPTVDLKAVPKRIGAPLPKTYSDFVTKVGVRRFADVDGLEGFHAQVLLPDELDGAHYRRGVAPVADDDEDSQRVDGVVFATTEHGDVFCFDIDPDRKEYEVFRHVHEMDMFEPYADNFAACIRRWADGASDREGQ